MKTQPEPECIRLGDPYDNPAFEALCREMGIWGTPQAALCAVFWRKAGAELAESIGAGGVSALRPVARRMSAQEIAAMRDALSSYHEIDYETAIVRSVEQHHRIK